MCTLYTYTNTWRPRFNASGFFGPPRCLVPTHGLTSSTPCAVCVRMCVYKQIHIRTFFPASKVEQTQDGTRIFPSVKNNPPRHAKSALHGLAESTYPRSLFMSTCAHPTAIVSQICTLMSKMPMQCTHTCMHWCLLPRTPVYCTPHSPQKNEHTPAQARP